MHWYLFQLTHKEAQSVKIFLSSSCGCWCNMTALVLVWAVRCFCWTFLRDGLTQNEIWKFFFMYTWLWWYFINFVPGINYVKFFFSPSILMTLKNVKTLHSMGTIWASKIFIKIYSETKTRLTSLTIFQDMHI